MFLIKKKLLSHCEQSAEPLKYTISVTAFKINHTVYFNKEMLHSYDGFMGASNCSE